MNATELSKQSKLS